VVPVAVVGSDQKFADLFADPKWLLDNLFKRYRVYIIPTNAGWATSNVGSGSAGFASTYLAVLTGTTANSRGMALQGVFGLNPGNYGRHMVDWDKYLELRFGIARLRSDPEVVARFQIKESGVEGPLAEKGLGVEVRNFEVYGESYGTARGTVRLGTLADNRPAYARIVKRRDRVEFYLNEALAGVLTGAYVPTGAPSTNCSFVHSIVNGPTGGVNAIWYVWGITVIQER
jgi:hypothetical protein